jgi:Tricorn protease C1 domain
MTVRGRLWLILGVVTVLACTLDAAQQKLSGFDRGLSVTMLRQAKQDLKQNYYDSNFHGIDIEKVFADAETKLREAASSSDATAALAEPLLKLDHSHTKFYPPERLTKTDYG